MTRVDLSKSPMPPELVYRTLEEKIVHVGQKLNLQRKLQACQQSEEDFDRKLQR